MSSNVPGARVESAAWLPYSVARLEAAIDRLTSDVQASGIAGSHVACLALRRAKRNLRKAALGLTDGIEALAARSRMG